MKALIGLIVLLLAAGGAYVLYEKHRIEEAISGPAKEIVSESMEKKGDTWNIEFVSKFDAPVDKVFEAFSKPERGHEFLPDNVLKSEVVAEGDNTKTVEIVGKLDILPPGFKVQTLRRQYTFDPGARRMSYKTIDFKLSDMTAQYKFDATADGKTVLRFTQTSVDKGGLPVESVQKGALREMFLQEVRIVNKGLGLAPESSAARNDAAVE